MSLISKCEEIVGESSSERVIGLDAANEPSTSTACFSNDEDVDAVDIKKMLTLLKEKRFAEKAFVEIFLEHSRPSFYKGTIPLLEEPEDMDVIRRVDTCMLFRKKNALGVRTPKIESIGDLRRLVIDVGCQDWPVAPSDSFHQQTPEYLKRRTFGFAEFLEKMEERDETTALNLMDSDVSGSEMDRLTELFAVPDFILEDCMTVQTTRMLQEKLAALPKNSKAEKARLEAQLGRMRNLHQYILIAQEKAFTGAHIDFGGVTTYVHVVTGKKLFFVATKPSEDEAAEEAEPVEEVWLGGIPLANFRMVELVAGDTFLLPAGTVHFVYTVEESIMWTGSFMLEKNAEHQFSVNNADTQLLRTSNYVTAQMYPDFEFLMTTFAEHVLLDAQGAIVAGKLKIAEIFVEHMGKKSKRRKRTKSVLLKKKSEAARQAEKEEKDRKRLIARLSEAVARCRAEESTTVMTKENAVGSSTSEEPPAKKMKVST